MVKQIKRKDALVFENDTHVDYDMIQHKHKHKHVHDIEDAHQQKQKNKTTTKTKDPIPNNKANIQVHLKTTTKKTTTKTAYDKIGQKKPTPQEGDSLRKFYTTLLKQKPHSKMALAWCLERGLLSTKKTTQAILVLEMDTKLTI